MHKKHRTANCSAKHVHTYCTRRKLSNDCHPKNKDRLTRLHVNRLRMTPCGARLLNGDLASPADLPIIYKNDRAPSECNSATGSRCVQDPLLCKSLTGFTCTCIRSSRISDPQLGVDMHMHGVVDEPISVTLRRLP
jgi:hypothetical protein